MLDTKYLYVFHGYGGENSLLPLAKYMSEQGHAIFTIDTQRFFHNREETLQLLTEQMENFRVVFLTSAHLWFDEYNYHDFYGSDPAMLSAIELMDFLHPICSVYYPHDLECFMHPSEMRWASLFDYVLLPYKNNAYYKLRKICRHVEIVGWIKKQHEISISHNNPSIQYSPVFFPSNIITFYQQLGVEGYAQWFFKYINPSIPLKMPMNEPELSTIMCKQGYTFIDASRSIYDTMSVHNLVIASGSSSIVYEAAFSGIPVITLLDGVFSDEVYRKELPGMKGIYPLHPEELNSFIEDINKNHIQLSTGPNILAPFDFEKVYHYITAPM
ncbi:MAG: hypothetical protein RR746_08280 [Lachnospiraceae bacterium]